MENIFKFKIIKCKQNRVVPFSFVHFFGIFKIYDSNFIPKLNIIIKTCLPPLYLLSFKISQFLSLNLVYKLRFAYNYYRKKYY